MLSISCSAHSYKFAATLPHIFFWILSHVSRVGHRRVMLRRQEHEPDPVEEVDAAQGRDPQVEEDPEDDGRRDHPQQRGHEDRNPDEQADAKSGNTLVYKLVKFDLDCQGLTKVPKCQWSSRPLRTVTVMRKVTTRALGLFM